MIRLPLLLVALALLVAFAPPAPAQSRGREPESLDALWLGEQVAGPRTVWEDLDGRVVLAYHWCVS